MNPPLSTASLRHLQMVAEVPDLSHTKYEIVEPIGRGGMGSVFLAKDRALDRMVALKVVGTFSRDTDVFDRLVREAKILARLDHPGVVPIYDVGRLPDERPFYTMKLVRGQRLDAHVSAQPSRLERLRIFERLCAVVAFAHDNHVVHCDLKPENVMVGRFGEVLVMDWGIATVDATVESSGVVIGTPGYMSPEQTRGEPADERADVYALGAILKFMFDSPAKPLAAIIRCAMADDAGARYQTVGALAADMSRFESALPVHAYRETIGDRSSRLARKYAGPIALVGAYLLMRMLLLAFAN